MSVKTKTQQTLQQLSQTAARRQWRHSESRFARAWRRFRTNKLALVALAVSILLTLLALGAPLISLYVTGVGPNEQSLLNNFAPMSAEHWFGTDELGRDVLTRIAFGARVSLGIAVLSVIVALTVGTFVGAMAAYYGGLLDTILMRFVDLMLSIPTIFLLILIGSLVRVGPATLALIIALLGWFGLSRLVRSEILSVKQRDYVEAARVIGVRDTAILLRHILPNILHIIIIWATIAIPSFILVEAALSFLGFGVQTPTPSWGNMLTNATQYFYKSIALVFIPGFFITTTVLALSIVGDALRDALDPYMKE
ncbi:MAG: ABC transporter permease [Chloroflexales bacterium]|nr:ABC transporter permease [Chloroflexales bacterium]